MSDRLTVGSLFSGVGGLDLGLEQAGHRVAFQCESVPWRREILKAMFPGVPCYEDVGEAEPAAEIDILCGGFP